MRFTRRSAFGLFRLENVVGVKSLCRLVLLAFAGDAIAATPAIDPGGIQNAASYSSGPISPGEIVVLHGSAMGPSQIAQFQVGSSGVVSTQLAGTAVLFNGLPAPIIYTSATQVAVVVPYGLRGTTAEIEVWYQGQASTPVAVPVATSAPGIFTLNSTGRPASVVNQDGSTNSPGHPAALGSYISLLATGEGQTSPQGQDGKLASVPLPQPILPVSAIVGGYSANVKYAGGAPGEIAGVMQVNIQIPEDVPLGNPAPVVLTVGGVQSNSVTIAVQGATVLKGLATTSISNTSPVPLTALLIGTSGLNLTVPVQVHFSNNAGFSITEQPVRVMPDGTIVAAVPIYVDPASQGMGSGTVSVTLSQENQSTAPQQVNIQSLPTEGDYGVQPGDISRAILVFDGLLLARRINELQAFQSAPGNTIDTSTAQSTLTTLLNAVVRARGDIDRVSADPSVVINAGTLPDGSTIEFDQNTLDVMDRVNGVFLTQTLATLGVPALTPQQKTGSRLRRTVPRQQASQLKDVLDLMETETGVNELVDAALEAGSAKDWIDRVQAAATALSVYLDQLPKSATTDGLGVAGAFISDARTIGDAFGDLGAYVYGEYTGDSELAFTAVQAMSDSRADLYSAGYDLVVKALDVEGLGTASTIAGFVKSYYDLGVTLQKEADSDTVNIAQEFASSPDGLQGVAYVTGQVAPPNNASASGQYEVQISSNGITFSALSDSSGDYQVFTNINLPTFGYATATINIVDPVTHALLGSKTIDLSISSDLCRDTQAEIALTISDLHYCDCIGPGQSAPVCSQDLINDCYRSAFNLINGLTKELVQDCTTVVP
jgi:uncharacterized protein (TIGR03437 family)